jgi:hypothetical protein
MNRIIKIKILYLLYLLLGEFSLYGQSISSLTNAHIGNIISLINRTDSNKLVTNYVLDSLVKSFYYKLNGVYIKDGKTVATSGTVDDKSITINYSLPKWGQFSLQPTISGSSDSGFVNIISGGKYKRTLTGGLNFNYFFGSSGFYSYKTKQIVLNQLKVASRCFNKNDKIRNDFIIELAFLNRINNNCNSLLHSNATSENTMSLLTDIDAQNLCADCTSENIAKFKKDIDELSQNYPVKGFDFENQAQLNAFINWLNNNQEQIAQDLISRALLKQLDSIQYNAKWNAFHHSWIAGNIKINQNDYPIFDAAQKSNLYTKDFKDDYISANISFNHVWAERKVYFYFSPNLTFQNNRNFDSKDSLNHLQKNQNFIVAGDTLELFKSTSFYNSVAMRKNMYIIEIPFLIYIPKSGLGFDFAIGEKITNSTKDLYARFGIYFPISLDANKIINLEPLIRFDQLNYKRLSFLQDMVSLGFNINFSVPKFISSK